MGKLWIYEKTCKIGKNIQENKKHKSGPCASTRSRTPVLDPVLPYSIDAVLLYWIPYSRSQSRTPVNRSRTFVRFHGPADKSGRLVPWPCRQKRTVGLFLVDFLVTPFGPWSHGPGRIGPRPLGPGPMGSCGPGSIRPRPHGTMPRWAQGPLGPGPIGPRAHWAQTPLGPGPMGPRAHWAQAPWAQAPLGPRTSRPAASLTSQASQTASLAARRPSVFQVPRFPVSRIIANSLCICMCALFAASN